MLKRNLKSQKGIGIISVLILSTLLLAAISYVILNLIPRLNDETAKSQSKFRYKVFISSLNDYVVHGIKERWCIEKRGSVTDSVNGVSTTFMKTSLLVSNDCGPTKSMKDIVTFDGNLERILWDDNTIGSEVDPSSPPSAGEANTITSLNYQERQLDSSVALILPNDVKVNALNFRIDESTLADMSSDHPLYSIAEPVRNCIKHIDISIAKEDIVNNSAVGDEKKLSIAIDVELKGLLGGASNRCSTVKLVDSKAYYSFIPRRNHTFSLIKYGDLSTNKKINFHSPVYIAGDLVLNRNYPKENSLKFLDSLTLGIYDSGSGSRKSGRIVFDDNTPYTFVDRGDPLKSKQRNYDSFRGILGGVKLDAIEDKGMVNLFDYTASSSVDLNLLEQCVAEQAILTTPSESSNAHFYYRTNSLSTSSMSFELGFSEYNRFKNNPSYSVASSNDSHFKFNKVAGVQAQNSDIVANLKLNNLISNSININMGRGDTVELSVEPSKFEIDNSKINELITALDLSVATNKEEFINYNSLFNKGSFLHGLIQTPSGALYPLYEKIKRTIDRCSRPAPHRIENFCSDYGGLATCDSDTNCSDPADFDTQINAYSDMIPSAVSSIIDSLNEIKDSLSDAKVEISLSKKSNSNSDTILNKVGLNIQAKSEFLKLMKYIDMGEFELEFKAFHYGTNASTLNIDFKSGGINAQSGLADLEFKTKKRGPLGDLVVENFKTGNYPVHVDQNIAMSNYPPASPISHNYFDVLEIDCPEGIGFASWGLDMSNSTNFSWNYANTPPGVAVDTPDHNPLDLVDFAPITNSSSAGFTSDYNASIVKDCIIDKDREIVYGFYVCEKLVIEGPRVEDLKIVGTFIVKNIEILDTSGTTIQWYSVWHDFSRDAIMTHMKASEGCNNSQDKNWKDVRSNPALKGLVERCSAQDLINNGPNNFTWTTIDPDIGIANAGDAMTSQKVKRFQRYIVKEISRKERIK